MQSESRAAHRPQSNSLGDPARAGSGSEHQEAEWQFDLPDREAVERWLGEPGGEPEAGTLVGGGRTRRLRDRYYDTGDWRLWRAGYALRVRTRGRRREATLKSLAEAHSGGLKRRREISEPLPSGEVGALRDPDGPVGGRLRALVGDRRLEELFEIRTRRLAYPLSGSGESAAGELVLDEAGILTPDGEEAARVDRVEVEAGAGGTEGLEAFVADLREACGLVPATDSKFGAGLRALGLAPPGEPDLGPTGVDPSLTLGEVAYAVMRRQFIKFLRHEPGARLGEDPEEVHDMRVASRRLRAALRVFEPALPPRERRFEPELKHFAAVLGEVRDLDVQLERLGEEISAAPEEARVPLAELQEELRRRREAARGRMLDELDSRRYERLVDTFSRMLRLGPPRRGRLSRSPVTGAAPDLVRRDYRRVRKVGDRLGPDSPTEEYHRLRKRCKRLRYLLEFLEEVYGKPTRKLVERLKPLQDVLGGLQDAEVARDRLGRLATEPGGGGLSHAAAFAMGGMAARYEHEAAEMRRRFPDAYDRIKGKRHKRLEKTMHKARRERGDG